LTWKNYGLFEQKKAFTKIMKMVEIT
jgi:hypothetical protein